MLEPLSHTAFAALLRKLIAPDSTKEARPILDRLEWAGFALFLPGIDDIAYRRDVEKAQCRASHDSARPGRFRRPRITASKEYR